MKSIWREPITLTEKQTLTAPGLRRILSISSERGALEAWFEVDTDAPERSLEIRVVGTGHPVPDEAVYIDTDIPAGGVFVWHFYSVEVTS